MDTGVLSSFPSLQMEKTAEMRLCARAVANQRDCVVRTGRGLLDARNGINKVWLVASSAGQKQLFPNQLEDGETNIARFDCRLHRIYKI